MREIGKVGIVGCGFFAQNHLHAWQDLAAQGITIAAVCDTDRAKAAKAAEQFGGEVFTDVAEMFAGVQLDLVDIVTQVRSHRPLVHRALDAGVATIVQKPFGQTLEDCVAMTEHARVSGVPLAIHENFRFQPSLVEAKAILERQEIGVPNWARISFRTGYDIYAGQPYLRLEERFVVADLGPHVLDLARFFLGEVEQITAQTQKRRADIAGEDTATMLLRHRSGAVSIVECTYEARRLPDPFPQTRIEIEGSNGSLIVADNYELIVTSGSSSRVVQTEPPVGAWMQKPWHVVQTSVVATCAHILAAFRESRSPSVVAHDNLNTIALCEAAYESAGLKQSVTPRTF